jgi:hypothetical protein
MRIHASARHRVLRFTALVALAATLSVAPPIASEDAGQGGAVWNFGTQEAGRAYPTEVVVVNRSCRGARNFSVAIDGEMARFLSITGPTRLDGIGPGQSKSTPALLDLTAAQPGAQIGGVLVIRCLNCPASCRLDYQRIAISLAVRGEPAAAPSDVTSSDPDGNLEFIPHVAVSWDGGDAPIAERDGALVVDLSPGSALWTTTDAALTTQARELCLEDLDPCAELLAKVRAAEEAYRRAQQRADDATRREDWDQEDAATLDEEAERDRAYAETLRRQAREWRELADNARADARTNRERAERQPDYGDSWRDEARRDDARAAERDANADRLEQEAERVEQRLREKTDDAAERRGRAEQARQEAAAAKEALDLARAEYEACLERQRLECERRLREAALAETRAREAAARAAAPPTTTTAPPPPPPTTGRPTSAFPGRKRVPTRLSPYCKWIRYELSRDAQVDSARVVAASPRDTQSAIEVRLMPSATTLGGKSFEYHCKADRGTATIIFEVTGEGAGRYYMRIGCTP